MDFYFEEINKEVLQRDILSNQDNESLLSVNNLSMQYDILYLICNVPFFNAASLYEIFAFCEKKNSVAKMVERLLQKGYVKTLKVPKHSDNYTTLFYITDKGHQLVSSCYPNCLPYKKKSGKNLEKIGVHDYGVGYSYLTYLHSPFLVTPEYEAANTLNKKYMSDAKAMTNSVRHDAILTLREKDTQQFYARAYIEHDTGTETASTLCYKILSYADLGITSANNHGDILHFVFRRPYAQTPSKFSFHQTKKLLDLLGDGELLTELYRKNLSADLLLLTKELLSLPDANLTGGTREDLLSYHKRLMDCQEPSYILYCKNYQLSFCYARRNLIIKYFMRHLKEETSDLYHLFFDIRKGFRITASGCATLTDDLPYFYMEQYPEEIVRYEMLLSSLLGSPTEYLCHRKEYSNVRHESKLPISFYHIFHNDTYDKDICIENISHDLSFFFRMYFALNGTYNNRDTNLLWVLLVDSFEDACFFAEALNFMAPFDFIYASYMSVAFLTIGEEDFYMIDKEKQKHIIREIREY